MEQAQEQSQSRRWAPLLLACAIAVVALLPPAATFHLALIAVSSIIAGSLALAAVIAITGRNLW